MGTVSVGGDIQRAKSVNAMVTTRERRAPERTAKVRAMFGTVLRALRVRRGLSQGRLTLEAGVDRAYVGNVERAESIPTFPVVDKLLGEMGVTWTEFGAALHQARRDLDPHAARDRALSASNE